MSTFRPSLDVHVRTHHIRVPVSLAEFLASKARSVQAYQFATTLAQTGDHLLAQQSVLAWDGMISLIEGRDWVVLARMANQRDDITPGRQFLAEYLPGWAKAIASVIDDVAYVAAAVKASVRAQGKRPVWQWLGEELFDVMPWV